MHIPIAMHRPSVNFQIVPGPNIQANLPFLTRASTASNSDGLGRRDSLIMGCFSSQEKGFKSISQVTLSH
jgi:hypothetical protein